MQDASPTREMKTLQKSFHPRRQTHADSALVSLYRTVNWRPPVRNRGSSNGNICVLCIDHLIGLVIERT